jgi:hypothetical protein
MSKLKMPKYKYTGKSFRNFKIEELSPDAIITLLAWGYVEEIIIKNNIENESI